MQILLALRIRRVQFALEREEFSFASNLAALLCSLLHSFINSKVCISEIDFSFLASERQEVEDDDDGAERMIMQMNA